MRIFIFSTVGVNKKMVFCRTAVIRTTLSRRHYPIYTCRKQLLVKVQLKAVREKIMAAFINLTHCSQCREKNTSMRAAAGMGVAFEEIFAHVPGLLFQCRQNLEFYVAQCPSILRNFRFRISTQQSCSRFKFRYVLKCIIKKEQFNKTPMTKFYNLDIACVKTFTLEFGGVRRNNGSENWSPVDHLPYIDTCALFFAHHQRQY